MLSGSEKTIVDVRDVDGENIEYTDKEGNKKTYYAGNYLSLSIESLSVGNSFGSSMRWETEAPTLSSYVTGVALSEIRSFAVIGDPKLRSQSISISFIRSQFKEQKEDFSDDAPAELRRIYRVEKFHGRLGYAMLGLNRADWKIRTDDEWFLECYVPEELIKELVRNIDNGCLTSMRLHLYFPDLYTDNHPIAPDANEGDLFLRPDTCDNSIENPEHAIGIIRDISFTAAKIDLRRPDDADNVFSDEDDSLGTEVESLPIDPVITSLEGLGQRIEMLHKTFKWVGFFIFAALLAIALK